MKLKTAEDLDAIDAMYSDPIPLFFQSGYLTIKDFDPEFLCYRLDFPNKEVEQGFARFMAVYYHNGNRNGGFNISHFVEALQIGVCFSSEERGIGEWKVKSES